MLVLSRKKNEVITIGDDIKICVVGIRGDTIRIGITAPSDVKIMRQELLDEPRGLHRPAPDSAN